MSIARRLLPAVAALVAVPAIANAQLVGNTVQVNYVYPSIGSTFASANVVVGAGTELPGFPGLDPRTNIDLLNSSIDITYNSAGSWNSAAFNGLHFFDVFATIDPFTSVTIGSTNMVGLDLSRITFDANNIYVNWQGLAFDEHTTVSLNVNASTVPEPATIVLLGAGLAGVGLVARRRRTA